MHVLTCSVHTCACVIAQDALGEKVKWGKERRGGGEEGRRHGKKGEYQPTHYMYIHVYCHNTSTTPLDSATSHGATHTHMC